MKVDSIFFQSNPINHYQMKDYQSKRNQSKSRFKIQNSFSQKIICQICRFNYNDINFTIKHSIMNQLDNKTPLSFSKGSKQLVRKAQHFIQTRQSHMKSHSASKSNLSKLSQKSQSKSKKHSTLHTIGAQLSPYFQSGNNAKSERCKVDNEETGKITSPNDCWSIETSVETKNVPKDEENGELRFFHKERSFQEIEKFSKKDRKFSQKVRNVFNDYQTLKEQHKLERQLMEMVLSEKQMHRLNKIYAVEQAQYRIRIINAEKSEKK